jgi:hypothetical protein
MLKKHILLGTLPVFLYIYDNETQFFKVLDIQIGSKAEAF